MKYFYTNMTSPVGKLTLVADEHNLCAICFPNQKPDKRKFPNLKKNENLRVLKSSVNQLSDYFAGKTQKFDLPLRPVGTDFQENVWKALRSIKYGKTVSYGDIAKKIGNPKAVRAVGSAIGKNPLSIIVPCHRVIGANGKLTGFAGGLKTKEFLLNFESK
ncbi:MAG: methylated-DNA--[protein]-cysteine S-methyltransferase [Thermodesulfobacteriota bacterium]